MKLVRFGAIGSEKPGLVDKAGKLRDLSAHVKDLAGDALSPASLAKIAALDPASLPEVTGSPRLGSPVGGAPKFVAIGLNYADHAAESGMPFPAEPIVFMNKSLQGNVSDAGTTFARFLVNSTIGVAGLFDVASSLGLPKTNIANWLDMIKRVSHRTFEADHHFARKGAIQTLWFETRFY